MLFRSLQTAGGDDASSVRLPIIVVPTPMPFPKPTYTLFEIKFLRMATSWLQKIGNNFIFHLNELLRRLVYFRTRRHSDYLTICIGAVIFVVITQRSSENNISSFQPICATECDLSAFTIKIRLNQAYEIATCRSYTVICGQFHMITIPFS